MGRIRHKRKNNHVVIVTSEAVDASVKQYRIRPWILHIIILVLCIIIGAMIGYFIYEKEIWDAKFRQTSAWRDEADTLAEEKAGLEVRIAKLQEEITDVTAKKDTEISELQSEIASLQEEILAMRATLDQKAANELELTQQIEKQYIPTEFPLTDAARMEEITEGNPMCVFTTGAGSMVIATAKGTVIAVNADAEFEQNVWIDHGNGYVTIYRNSGEVKVKQGETVTQGTTLFLIDDADSKLGYQMLKDGVYINPMDVLAISG